MKLTLVFTLIILLSFHVFAKKKHQESEIIPHCNLTDSVKNSCVICDDGYVEDGKKCKKCPKFTKVCSVDLVILECDFGFALSEDGKECVLQWLA